MRLKKRFQRQLFGFINMSNKIETLEKTQMKYGICIVLSLIVGMSCRLKEFQAVQNNNWKWRADF